MPTRIRSMLAMVVVACLVASIAVAAGLYRGIPGALVQLHDGGVWVTNQSRGLVGFLNYPAKTLAGGVRTPVAKFDIAQSGQMVSLLHESGARAVQSIDGAAMTVGSASPAAGLSFAQGGGIAALWDSRTGRVWDVTTGDISNFSMGAKPVLDGLPGLLATVALSGTIFVVAPSGEVRSITQGVARTVGQIDGLPADLKEAEVSCVGDDVVVLDRASRRVFSLHGSWTVVGGGMLKLQQPSGPADRVVVSGTDGMYWASLSGADIGSQITGVGAGLPAAPVSLDGCVYGAWGGTSWYLRDCPGTDSDVSVPAQVGEQPPAFRVNRDVIVLNDTHNGNVYLVNDQMRLVANWQDVQSQHDDQTGKNDPNGVAVLEKKVVQRSPENHPPTATDDVFGVRPGRATSLPVTRNDNDPDGDVLTAEPEGKIGFGQIGLVRGGEALQVTLNSDAKPTETFTYVVRDGRGGEAKATVTLHTKSAEVETAPKCLGVAKLDMGAKSSTNYNVFPDWVDDEGDPLVLQNAIAPDGMAVSVRPDGLLTIRDLGTAAPGLREIEVTVSDGTLAGGGKVQVMVSGGEDRPPLANADHLLVLAGREGTSAPLLNDTDPDGNTLSLAAVGAAEPGQTIVPDLLRGTFTFHGEKPGTYYVPYTVTDGPSAAEGVVRVDVIADEGKSTAPVAEPDVALLPSSGSVTVDVLTNDTDPLGGVLVIQSVQAPQSGRFTVEVVDRFKLRISAPQGLDGVQQFTYTVSNGAGVAQGQVRVMPLPDSLRTRMPVAMPDEAVVRAGDIVSVGVVANDLSPNGTPLELQPNVQAVPADRGIAFVSGNSVRFKANRDAQGTVRVTYTVKDAAENIGSAELAVLVTKLDENNQAPQPKPVVSRVLAGQKINIRVPTDGIDPDGDSVTLVGLDVAPLKGTATVEAGYLRYEAPATASGTDYFRYTVMDRFGARASAAIAMGISRPSEINQPPVAVQDTVAARPRRIVDVPVLRNDVDPEGGKISLVAGSITPVDPNRTAPAEDAGNYLRITTPGEEGTFQYYYEIRDELGASAQGVATIEVSKDAALRPPVAIDDVLTSAEVTGKETIDVDVLTNDSDPDGSKEELKVTVGKGEEATIVNEGRLRVALKDDRQVLVYEVTDKDGLVAKAAVIVPGKNSGAPTLNLGKIPARVKAGELLEIPLSTYVVVRDGRSPRLTFVEKVQPGVGNNGESLVKDLTNLRFTSTEQFQGTSSITFEVTDGSSPEDPSALKATLTLPITVEPSGKHQPVPHPSEVKLVAGEAAREIDLKTVVSDVDPGDMDKLQFSSESVTGGYNAALNGNKLSVAAPVDHKPGATGSIELTVTDGTTSPVRFMLPLATLPTSKPLMTVRPAHITAANAGKAEVVKLTQYVTNPFAAEGKPITVVDPPTVTSGKAEVSSDEGSIIITPDKGFHGEVLVTYRVADATKLAEREAGGTITLTVRDRPEPPTGVTAASNASKSATVTWTTGANNGSPISNFTVYWADGKHECGQATSCTFSGLTNDKPYTFWVTAKNEAGESEPSQHSNQVTPDVRPEQPMAPKATFGNKQISLTWDPAKTEGSSVRLYTVEIKQTIADSTGGALQRTAEGTTLVWTGLTNGTGYQFRIRAENNTKTPSDWSPYSTVEIPAGLPEIPAAPRITKTPVSTLQPSVTLEWDSVTNGDNPTEYEIKRSDGRLARSVDKKAIMSLATSTTPYTFQVRAKNKAGWGEFSAATSAVRSWTKPTAVGGLTVTATGKENTARIWFTPATAHGVDASEIRYEWRANGASGTVTPNQEITHSAFVNGQNVPVTVVAIVNINNEPAETVSEPINVSVWGPPAAPAVASRGTANAEVVLEWNASNAGRGRPITAVEVFIDGVSLGKKSVYGTAIRDGWSAPMNKLRHCIKAKAWAEEIDGPMSNESCSEGNETMSAWLENELPVPNNPDSRVDCINPELDHGNKCVYVKINARGWLPNKKLRCEFTWEGKPATIVGPPQTLRIQTNERGEYYARVEGLMVSGNTQIPNYKQNRCVYDG